MEERESNSQVKRAYMQPAIQVIKLQCESVMQGASGNAGTIGQGNGTPAGDAKQGFFDMEEDEVFDRSLNVWEE